MTALLKKKNPADADCSWDLDKLDRKEVAKYLTTVIGSIRQPFVISLNSPYGTGKTFFVRSWQKQLIADGYKAVYFNAWETDYSEDALIAFIGSIKSQLEDNSKGKAAKKITDLAKAGGSYLGRKILPALAKGLARKALGSETVKELGDLADKSEGDITDLAGDIAADSLRRHEAVSKSISAFKKKLQDLVADLTKNADHDDKKKLIIFVDELDRCRPLYAVEVLECIKHLFGVSGVVFVLAVDAVQLKSVVAQLYGLGEHGEGYLRKFIDWQLSLPAPSAHQYARHMYDEFKLEETMKFNKGVDYFVGKDAFLGTFGVAAEAYRLSLREIAQIFTECNLFLRSAPEGVCGGSLLAIIAVLKHFHPAEDFKKICLGEASCSDLLGNLEAKLSPGEIRKYIPDWQRFKQLTHACFLVENKQEYRELEYELTNLPNPKSDEFLQADERRRDEIIQRSKYIDALFKMLSWNVPHYGEVSPAAAIFKGLEKASFLMNYNAKNH